MKLMQYIDNLLTLLKAYIQAPTLKRRLEDLEERQRILGANVYYVQETIRNLSREIHVRGCRPRKTRSDKGKTRRPRKQKGVKV